MRPGALAASSLTQCRVVGQQYRDVPLQLSTLAHASDRKHQAALIILFLAFDVVVFFEAHEAILLFRLMAFVLTACD